METKNVEAKQVLAGSLKTTLNKLQADCDPVIERLMIEAESMKIAAIGPLEFIYTGATEDKDKEFHLEIAMPVNVKSGVTLPEFEIKVTPVFKCASHTYKGKMENIGGAYHQVFDDLQSKSLRPTEEIREVYENWVSFSSEENIVEIQIGIN